MLQMTLLWICAQRSDNSCIACVCAKEMRFEESEPCGRGLTPDNSSKAWLTILLLPQVLVIIAASHLDAVTFQICSQSFKIMPTAVFAAWLLGQHLTAMQWSSLPVRASGSGQASGRTLTLRRIH